MNNLKTTFLLVLLTVLSAKGMASLFSTHLPVEEKIARLQAMVRGTVS